ncbi:hypothetical protein HYG86_15305 [Alkalicella caledoniensis]|uniref:DUF4252 domain-containing protein n=1 Tax=Alkalicella caledoniensis TaxID=2731377 RepID=A0A7G9WBH4_ALKCA|nr:hypothetical protein [Alkalicella caledoniensis]QNO16036.1 hypothetical protein HYG86_15305 [Alkalicella caledoniensis]
MSRRLGKFSFLLALFMVVGCSTNGNQLDPEAMLKEQIENLNEVNSYRAEMTLIQEVDNIQQKTEVLLLQNMREKSLFFSSLLEGQKMIELSVLDDIFTMSLNNQGKFEKTSLSMNELDDSESLKKSIIIGSFHNFEAFTNLVIEETSNYFVITGDSTINSLIGMSILDEEIEPYDIEEGAITIYISKKTNLIEKMYLENVMNVGGTRIITKTEAIISDINRTNNIAQKIG